VLLGSRQSRVLPAALAFDVTHLARVDCPSPKVAADGIIGFVISLENL
jgi:hypothetical protein